MAENFNFFKNEIRKCFIPLDINYFIMDLKELFFDTILSKIYSTDINQKVDVFFDEFIKLERPEKFEKLKRSAEKHNKLIYQFLTVDIRNENAVLNLRGHLTVLENLLEMFYKAKNRLWVIDRPFIGILFNKEIITEANKCFLLKRLETYGAETTMFELFNVVSARNSDWYGVILYNIFLQKTSFSEVIFEELELEPNIHESAVEGKIMDLARDFVEKHINQFREENPPKVEEDSDQDDGYDDGLSCDETASRTSTRVDVAELDDYGSNTIAWLLNSMKDMKPSKLRMKNFQLELAQSAVKGENVIVYAPTGIGKTIVAIYIANEHLKRNPNGKVAFLVPRRHLVMQQYMAFEKFKDPDVNVMEMRAKSESKIGPLKTHLENYQVFVMTGGIFFNALTVDDGNKLSSISEFSLIFFDECHNCTKSNPYNQIMCEYIKEKMGDPSKVLPQIVGLTASPRSNNSDDKRTMRKSVLELCANLDCFNFAFVKKNVEELRDEIVTPVQEVLHVPKRDCNEFETSLTELMEQCEKKLEKMKSEQYFSKQFYKCVPSDKFSHAYGGFVGKLHNLNDYTIEENDGKQKAYAIYRYLNAYYRGLIVNQLFDEVCAKECIDRFLYHDGANFTCCYDEEFNKSYKVKIPTVSRSENPAIEKIKYLINNRFKCDENSRILIFVQQVAYTNYLAEYLTDYGNIEAQAIVGCKNKNDLKGCSRSNINDILDGFKKGLFKVLVATSVVEEGLDVPDCNMVICYGYVTNEIALIQRLGRARAIDSKYYLVLPPMFQWMENKENNNRRRNETMVTLIKEYDQSGLNTPEMIDSIKKYQEKLFNLRNKTISTSISSSELWQFKCKSCQHLICTSEELRILEISHIVCINPEVIRRLIFIPKKVEKYGLFESYEMVGSFACVCRNHRIGKKVLYLKNPYLQIRIDRCTVTKNERTQNFRKWKDFTTRYPVNRITEEEMRNYVSEVWDLDE